jgi:hypothetical protein
MLLSSPSGWAAQFSLFPKAQQSLSQVKSNEMDRGRSGTKTFTECLKIGGILCGGPRKARFGRGHAALTDV